MTILKTARIQHRRAGTYLAIFASGCVSLFLAALLAEQLGANVASLNAVLCAVPLVGFAAIGLVIRAEDVAEFYNADRAMPSFASGLALAVAAVGGTGVVCITGALFKIGMDALVLVLGWITGLVITGIVLFPFIRKCGACTVPSYLGMRLDSRLVRLVAACVMIVPSALILAAEIRVGAFATGWLTGLSEFAAVPVIALVATACVILGGQRGLTWASVTQSITLLFALTVPATIVSLLISNLPFPQMMHGNLLQGLRRTEMAQPFAALSAGTLSFSMPGVGLEPFTAPFLTSFGAVGRLSFPLAILVIATGLGALPSVLNRAGTVPTVYDSRKSVGWAVLTAAFMLLTMAAIAGFFRGYVVEQIAGAAGDRLPLWFQALQQYGHAGVAKTRAALTLAEISMHRDVAVFALPMAAGMPQAIVALAAVGAIAAAATGAAAQIAALGGILSEDVVHGGRTEPPEDRTRLITARVMAAAVGAAATIGAWLVSDPLAAVLAALSLSAATAFPVLVMSILWRKVSRTAAIAGMATGFGVTLVLMAGGLSGLIPMAPVMAATLGGPLNFAVLVIISEASPLRSRHAMEVVRDIRLPGGEATYDRDMRLLRRKRITSAL